MGDWVVIVDDDMSVLKTVGYILSENNVRVTALKSGKALLDYFKNGAKPDLVMLDILMPEMNGFEVFKKLREFERDNDLHETPIVFLTADENKSVEAKGFEMGALDFIKKPFEPDVLYHRVRNILTNTKLIHSLSEEVAMDKLTGILNKDSVTHKLEKVCPENDGALVIIDIDSFKLVNDIFGHDEGDKILNAFSVLLRSNLRIQDTVGRIGGDEFVAFLSGITDEENIKSIIYRLNTGLVARAAEILGDDIAIPLGVSGGAVITSGGIGFMELFEKADEALRFVKQNGKHDCVVYSKKDGAEPLTAPQVESIRKLNMILDERNVSRHALWLGQEAFSNIYRYMLRYIQRYREKAYKVLFTLIPMDDGIGEAEFAEMMTRLGETTKSVLRNSDIMMQSASNQFFLLLPMVKEEDINKVIGRIISAWEKTDYSQKGQLMHEAEAIVPDDPSNITKSMNVQPWVFVVDDDISILKTAGTLLSEKGMRVTALNSGQALLDYISDGNIPDIILLDVMMPDMDGFDTLKKLREYERGREEVPVIFLTGVDDQECEARGLSMGAMDFIKKPFVPEVLTIRVEHSIELVNLHNNLSIEVDRKTSENEQLFLQIVQTLAGTIDAKDTYTKGHSSRVAKYTREIARRYGYSAKEQDDIYMIGVLHDVGKIGVPDEVINKPSRLTDEEFAMIKKHPVIGGNILSNISNMPKLATGAKWHHERYDGRGYPDGLSGEDIPEEARIIAVADAYDAMTSNRSYREALPQEVVRGEIEKGKGTQFDPVFADIMLDMIDEDKDYQMREIKEEA